MAFPDSASSDSAMHPLDSLARLAQPFAPQRPIAELVEELNRIHHAFEAAQYDQQHDEISEQLPGLWREMLRTVDAAAPGRTWRVLDFGCGTGFEAQQLLGYHPRERIAALKCYDLSPEMLAECRRRLAGLYPGAEFVQALADLPGQAPYDLLLTNSLLHHLPDPLATLQQLEPLLSADALWIAGHEPSARFYRNPACATTFAQFCRRKYLDPRRYVGRLRRMFGAGPPASLAQKVADEAFRRGLFAQKPSAALVGRLVDAGVAHSPEEVAAGRGLDFEELARRLEGRWRLLWVRTYSFMGYIYEGRLPAKWRQRAAALAAAHPKDGANFSCVWRRGAD